MKFRVEREALGEAVAWVARALPARPVVPVLSGMLLQAKPGELLLSCFDYEVSARIAVPAEVADPGTALVPGRLLAEITRSLPAAAAEFSADADMVSLTCGSAEFGLVSLPVDEYPALPEPPSAAGTIDGSVLAAAAAQVVPSASRDDTLPMLTAVCLDIDGETITLAATDRYRLAVSEVRWAPAAAGLTASLLVPARILADVARTMAPGQDVALSFGALSFGMGTGGGTAAGRAAAAREQAPGGPDAGPAQAGPVPGDGMITFAGGGRRLTARLIGGEFIRYQSRFPAEFGCSAELPAGPFIEAVRRVSLVAERASPVRLAFEPHQVVIEAHAEGRARALESVPAEFTGPEPVISFNPHYLLDGLTAAALAGPAPGSGRRSGPAGQPEPDAVPPQSGRIRLDFTSPTKPALVTWAHDQASGAAQADTVPAKGEQPGSGTGGARPSFRYLVDPLRAPARA